MSGRSGTWARGEASEVVRRAHPASGAQWNVQVVKGKVNGKCLWNACKALSLGLLLMVLGAAMATIGYYADHLSIAQEVRGNHTVAVKNESRGFHLNNLSYAGPIVMGVGGFIVVAACVMTFEARDSAAKVVPAARFNKISITGLPPGYHSGHSHSVIRSGHGSSLRNTGTQPTGSIIPSTSHHGSIHGGHYDRHHGGHHGPHHISPNDRHALTQSFMHFSRGLTQLETSGHHQATASGVMARRNTLKVKQGSINRSPSAPDLVLEKPKDQSSPTSTLTTVAQHINAINKPSSRRTFAAHALLNPGLIHRHALSVDETAANYRSNESLHGASSSQGSMALDLHLECPVTLRVRDKRRNPPLKRQRKIEDEQQQHHHHEDSGSRRSSHSCSPRLPSQHHLRENANGGSAHQLPSPSTSPHQAGYHYARRRSSNTSECSHRSRSRRKSSYHIHTRGRLERAISSDSRLPTETASPRCYRSYEPSRNNSTEQEAVAPQGSNSETDVRQHKVMVHFSPTLSSKFGE